MTNKFFSYERHQPNLDNKDLYKKKDANELTKWVMAFQSLL